MKRFGCFISVAAMVASLLTLAPVVTSAAGAAPGPTLDSCTIAGSASGSFPAWNAIAPVEQHAVAPDGSIVFAARGLIWRFAAGAVTRVAGGGTSRPDASVGSIGVDDLRLDAAAGLDVAADGTIWATDGRTLFHVQGSTVVPDWTPQPMLDPDGMTRPTTLAEVRVSAAGAFVAARRLFLGSDVWRIHRYSAGSVTEVAGGGSTSPREVTTEVEPSEISLYDEHFGVDDSGRLVVADPSRFVAMGGDGKFRQLPTVGAVVSFSVAANGVVTASDDTGPIRYQGGTWNRLPGPRQDRLDVAADGSLVAVSGTYLRRTASNGTTTPLTGWDATKARFTNSGRTASTAFLGSVTAVAQDGEDLLVAESVPTAPLAPGDAVDATSRIVRLRPDGTVVLVAGNGDYVSDADVGPRSPGPAAQLPIGLVTDIDVDATGQILFVSRQFGVNRIGNDGVITQLAPTTTVAVLYAPTAAEQLPDGRIVVGLGEGTLQIRAVDGTISQWVERNDTGASPVPLSEFGLQYVDSIESDRKGALILRGEFGVWRMDLSKGVATRLVTWTGQNQVAVAADTGPAGGGVAVDRVGNVIAGGNVADPEGRATDLWRIGADDAVSTLGRTDDRVPAFDVGDPDDTGLVGGVAVDHLGRTVLTDAVSGRVRRLGCTTPSGTGVHPVVPARLLDTRDGTGTGGARRPGPGELVELQVSGRGGVASGATAATLNVTVADPVAASYLTVWPCDREPTVSNVNFAAGAVVPNQVNVALSADGTVCLRSPVAANMIVDVQAWFGVGGEGLRPLTPTRLLDTRDQGGRIPAGSEVRLHVTGRAGVPSSGATAAAINVTVTDPTSSGWLTAYPCGSARPLASNLNFVGGQTVPNAVLARVGDGGDICLFASASTHVVVDVVGSWDAGGQSIRFVRPERSVDTRSWWGAGMPTRLRAGQPAVLVPTGSLGVPADASSVVVNATAVGASGSGFVTLYPCDAPLPVASTLNLLPGDARANAALTRTAADGSVCALSSTDVDLILDVAGYAD